MNDTRGRFWVVYKDGDKACLNTFNLRDRELSYSLDNDPFRYYVYMDNWSNVGTPVYDSATKTSTITLPYEPTQDLFAYTLDKDSFRGRSAKVTVDGLVGTLTGDWSNAELAVGYEMEMRVELPKFYVQRAVGQKIRSDTTASLTIHRVAFDFGLTGMFDVSIKRFGKDDYNVRYETTEMDEYRADAVPVYYEKQFTIPIYDRASSCDITITSAHPTPATLISATYEGDYSDKYYKRV